MHPSDMNINVAIFYVNPVFMGLVGMGQWSFLKSSYIFYSIPPHIRHLLFSTNCGGYAGVAVKRGVRNHGKLKSDSFYRVYLAKASKIANFV